MTAAPAVSISSTARRKLASALSQDKPALRPADTLRTAGDRMRALHAEAWPVVEGQCLVGMIDMPNPDWRAQAHGHDPDLSYVSGCVNSDVSLHCYDDDDCSDTLRLMLERHLLYVPVTDHEMHFIGVASVEGILNALIASSEDAAGSQKTVSN